MFESLSKGFESAALRLRNQGKFTLENLKEPLDSIQRTLLDADVHLDVIRKFTHDVQEKSLGAKVLLKAQGKSVTLSDHFIKICHDALIEILTAPKTTDNFLKGLTQKSHSPHIIFFVGLQGAGKTTHVGKLAFLLKTKNLKVGLIAADTQRPAAKEQLKLLGEQVKAPVFTTESSDAYSIVKEGISHFSDQDVILVDTAGRLTVDSVLMNELVTLNQKFSPENILLVMDGMIGQDSLTTALAFKEKLPLTGAILTKLDGDTRGGAALSLSYMTHLPIFFIGTGEKLNLLETFRAEGMASRILGMGDVLSLMDDFEKAIDSKTEKNLENIQKGHFSFSDYENMMQTLFKMGPLQGLLSKMPFKLPQLPAGIDDKTLKKKVHMIQSMTKYEKNHPDSFKGPQALSRMQRIAKGSGNPLNAVQDLIQEFFKMKQMLPLLSGMSAMGGGIPGMKPPSSEQEKPALFGASVKLEELKKMASMGKAMKGSLSASQIAEVNRELKRKKQEKAKKRK